MVERTHSVLFLFSFSRVFIMFKYGAKLRSAELVLAIMIAQ